MKSRISIRSRLKEFMIYCISRGLILILLIFVCYSALFWLLSGFDNVVFVKVLLMLSVPTPFAFLIYILIMLYMGYTIRVKYIEFNDDTVLVHYRGGKLLLNNKNVHEIKRTKKPLPMLYLRHQPKEKSIAIYFFWMIMVLSLY